MATHCACCVCRALAVALFHCVFDVFSGMWEGVVQVSMFWRYPTSESPVYQKHDRTRCFFDQFCLQNCVFGSLFECKTTKHDSMGRFLVFF